MLVTFYNAVICSLLMFVSVCWGRNILIEGGWKILYKKAGHVVGMPLDNFKTLYEKGLLKKTNANIK